MNYFYKVGEKVLVYAIIDQVIETKQGIVYCVKPDVVEHTPEFMRVPEDCVKSSDEIIEECNDAITKTN